MIPIEYRITRYRPSAENQRVAPVSGTNRVDPTEPRDATDRDGRPKEQHAPKGPDAFSSPAFSSEDLNLLAPRSNPFRPYHVEEALSASPEHLLSHQDAHLLALLRPNRSDAALSWALIFSAIFGCRLHLLLSLDEKAHTDPEFAKNETRDRLQALIDEHHQRGFKGDLIRATPMIDVTFENKMKDDFNRLTLSHGTSLAIAERSVDLVLNGLILDAHCPVLTLNQNEAPERIRNIVVAMDGTPFSYIAIRQGIALAESFKSALHLFHVSTPQEPKGDTAYAPLLNRMQWHGVEHDLIVAKGGIAEALVDYANNHEADLIIMGAHRIQDRDKDSISMSVVLRAPCAVLIVHPYRS